MKGRCAESCSQNSRDTVRPACHLASHVGNPYFILILQSQQTLERVSGNMEHNHHYSFSHYLFYNILSLAGFIVLTHNIQHIGNMCYRGVYVPGKASGEVKLQRYLGCTMGVITTNVHNPPRRVSGASILQSGTERARGD